MGRHSNPHPHTPPNGHFRSSDKRSADLDSLRLGWSGGCRPAGSPDLSSGPSATARAWNGHPGFRSCEKAPRACPISELHCRTQPATVVALLPCQFGCRQCSVCCRSPRASELTVTVAYRSQRGQARSRHDGPVCDGLLTYAGTMGRWAPTVRPTTAPAGDELGLSTPMHRSRLCTDEAV